MNNAIAALIGIFSIIGGAGFGIWMGNGGAGVFMAAVFVVAFRSTGE